jgi:hypothetical protein
MVPLEVIGDPLDVIRPDVPATVTDDTVPLPFVVHDKTPDPLVVKTCPDEPLLSGKIQVLDVVRLLASRVSLFFPIAKDATLVPLALIVTDISTPVQVITCLALMLVILSLFTS